MPRGGTKPQKTGRDLLTESASGELDDMIELLRAETYRDGGSVEWDTTESVQTNVDWHALARIARQPTPRERLAAITTGKHRLRILFLAAGLTPVVWVWAHEWASGTLRGARPAEIFIVLAVLLTVVSMGTLFLYGALAAWFGQPSASTKRPWFSHEISLLLAGTWVLLWTGGMYWSARVSTMLTPGRAMVFVASPELAKDDAGDASVAVQDGMALYLGSDRAAWRQAYPEVAKALKSNHKAATPLLVLPQAAQDAWMRDPELRQHAWPALLEHSPTLVARMRLKMMRSWLESMNNFENAAAVHGALAALPETALTVYDVNRKSVSPGANDYAVLRARVELEVRLLVQETLGSLSGWKGCPPSLNLSRLVPTLESTIAGGSVFSYDAGTHELRLKGADARLLGTVDFVALEGALRQSCDAVRPLRASTGASDGPQKGTDANQGEN